MKKLHNRIQMNIFISVLLLFLGAALIVLCAYLFVCGSMANIHVYSEVINLSIIFNYLPVLLLAVMFAVLCGNVFYGLGITTLIVDTMAFADHYMIIYRGEPLSYGDLFALKEGVSAVHQFSVEIDYIQLFLIIAVTVVLLFFGYITRSSKLKKFFRIFIAGIIFAINILCCSYIFSYDFKEYSELLENEQLSVQYNRNIRCKMVGPVFFFIDSYKDYKIEKPDSYDKYELKKQINDNVIADISDEQVLPDVIFVACECFSDLADIDFVNYSYNNNPISEFHDLCKAKNSISGYIYTPVFGGGTCNTELEILRSMFVQYSSGNMANTVRGKKDSIVTQLEEYGYHSIYIHPGDDWFYNRQNIMTYIGFDETYFNDDFKNPNYVSEHISDESVAEFIIEKYQEHCDDGNPLFMNAMTIAGHFPFYWEEGMTYASINGELSPQAHTELSMYLQRMSHTNNMMKTLSSYYSDVDNPVILVFYGDHLPALGYDGSVFTDINYPIYDENGEETSLKYKIPYVIWGNSAASEYFDNNRETEDGGNISAAFLGVDVLDLIGLAKGNAYYDFLLDLKQELPIIHKNFCIDSAGEEYKNIPNRYQEQIKTLANWNYYYLKDN